MIRLVTQFDDNRVRATAATPTCGACCCCCCCCLVTALTSTALTQMNMGRLAAKRVLPPEEPRPASGGTGFATGVAIVLGILFLGGFIIIGLPVAVLAAWIIILARVKLSRSWLKIVVAVQVVGTLFLVEFPGAAYLILTLGDNGRTGLLVYLVLALTIAAIILAMRRNYVPPVQATNAPVPSSADFAVPPPNTALPSRDLTKPEEKPKS